MLPNDRTCSLSENAPYSLQRSFPLFFLTLSPEVSDYDIIAFLLLVGFSGAKGLSFSIYVLRRDKQKFRFQNHGEIVSENCCEAGKVVLTGERIQMTNRGFRTMSSTMWLITSLKSINQNYRPVVS